MTTNMVPTSIFEKYLSKTVSHPPELVISPESISFENLAVDKSIAVVELESQRDGSFFHTRSSLSDISVKNSRDTFFEAASQNMSNFSSSSWFLVWCSNFCFVMLD